MVPADTAQLSWKTLPNGDVTVAPQFGYKFAADTQLVTFHLPADSGAPCDSTVTYRPSGCSEH